MVQRKFLILFSLFICFAVFLCGCPKIPGVLPYSEMSTKQKAAYFFDVYNAQYDDYVYVSSKEGLAEAEKAVLRKKKEILKSLWKAIIAYDTVVNKGEIPTADQEDLVLKFINDLLYGKEGGG